MMRSLIFFALFCVVTIVKAQYEPQFSHNMFNLALVNPGFAGSSGKVAVTSLNRMQLNGLKGAPRTTVFSADAGVKFMGFEHGVGVNFMAETIGSYTNQRISATYAFKVDLSEGQLSTGISLGGISQILKMSDLFTNPNDHLLGNQDAFKNSFRTEDNLLKGSGLVTWVMDLGLGVYYSQKKMYGGVSVLHFNQPKNKPDPIVGLSIYIKRTWIFTGGYTFELIDKPLEIIPSVYLKTDEASYQLDLNTIFRYKKRFWGGLTYRYQDAIVVLAGLEMKNGLKVGYSYDFTTSQLAGFGTHELMLSYWFSVGISKKSKQYRSVRYL